MYRKELFEFCKQNIGTDKIMFDEILDIFDIIKSFLINNNLSLKHEDNGLLIKLVHFLYQHSSHAEQSSKKKLYVSYK